MIPVDMKLAPQLRHADIVRVESQEDADVIEFSFSSEEPYERGWGIEVLGHNSGEVDLDWMASGRAPLLVDHDPGVDNQVGVIEKAWIENGRGKARARFGKTARAQDILQRVKDGMLSSMSVGYRIGSMLLTEEKDDVSTYRVTSWKPFEASLVTIPADPTVGVGRAGQEWSETTVIIERKNAMSDKAKAAVETVEKPAVDPNEVIKSERSRIADITAIGKQFNLQTDAEKAVRDGATVEAFRGHVLDKLGETAQTVMRNETSIGMTEKEQQDFSFLKAIRALAYPRERRFQEEARFEIEASQTYAEKTGAKAAGIMVPTDVIFGRPSDDLARAMATLLKRDLNVGTGSAGGYLVSTDLMSGSFIDLLRANLVLAEAGARMMTGLVGNVAIPKQTAAGTAYWISSEGGAPTESQQTLGQVSLSPKTVGAFTDLTRQFILQSSLDAEAFVRMDFAQIMALKIDLAGLYGSGSSGEPQGVKNTSGINTQDFASAGSPTWAEIVGMESSVDADNALMGSMAYICHPTMVGTLKTKEKASSTAQFIWENGNQVNGYRGLRTTQMTSDEILFGNWADLIIGMWGGLDITVDPYTASTSGTTRIVALQSVDVAVRHAESFCHGDDGY